MVIGGCLHLVVQQQDRIHPPREFNFDCDQIYPSAIQFKCYVPPSYTLSTAVDEVKETYNMVLQTELFGSILSPPQALPTGPSDPQSSRLSTSPVRTNVLKYKSNRNNGTTDPLSSSLISPEGQKLLVSPRKLPRKIAKEPFKVLASPSISDDFYLNLVHWSHNNLLAVGLGSSVFLWNGHTGLVNRLCELSSNRSVTSVSWSSHNNTLAVGNTGGTVEVYDVGAQRLVRTFGGHRSRVGTIAWNPKTDVISTGSRDRSILHRDMRSPDDFIVRQELCGLKWSHEGERLASGGNDNQLLVWDVHSESPLLRFTEHTAAVKALAWSPHQRGILASGGGTADRCIRFWNSSTGQTLHHVDTGSQVCNLEWSKNVNELVSTHGYSQNQIIVWSYPQLTQIATLTGHKMRVLYLSISPDGQTVVTGAGDQTLRFWNIFPPARGATCGASASLSLRTDIR
ncbi:hypothetical protein PROFUN_07697 [Planoprotostelium fungivorum]|uniref:CDC20/Fizzy WD40 domain-containing protein n=1 Tax=Planoprotostelium fungivorum TaxID=1890364 RepID=A0A2P6MM72_9EUKA|nr:hypothetical protein PROFUN_07697 [Planoprotostelium fungivorum]